MTKEKLTELLKIAYRWGRDNGEGRSEKNFNDLLDTKAVNEALHMHVVSTRFELGKIVKIDRCIYGHNFEIGQTVEIVDHEASQTTSWLCTDGTNSWWLSEDEGNVC